MVGLMLMFKLIMMKDLDLFTFSYDGRFCFKIDGWLLGALLIIMVLNFQLLYP